MFGKISAIILLVADAPKLISFYRDVIGMQVKQESEDWIELSTKGGSTVLALYPKKDKKTPSSVKEGLDSSRSMLIGFNVSDLDSVCKDLDKKGVRFFKKPCV